MRVPARLSRRFLRHIADARAGWGLDPSLVGLVDPGDRFEQRRFPSAVSATKPARAFGGSAAEALSRMRWPPRRSVMPSSVIMQ
jgi:hypothetical protein